MRRLLISLILISAAALISYPAAAADNGFYLGGSVGATDVSTVAPGGIAVSGDSTGYKVFGGYRMLTFLSVEGSYRDLGTVDGNPDSSTTYEAGVTGYDLQAVAYIPLGIADIFGKVGMIQWNADLSNGTTDSGSTDGSDPIYGAGVQFRIKSFAIRGEVEYLDIQDFDHVYMYSIGGSYTF